jgi:hypothetical protein
MGMPRRRPTRMGQPHALQEGPPLLLPERAGRQCACFGVCTVVVSTANSLARCEGMIPFIPMPLPPPSSLVKRHLFYYYSYTPTP